MSDHVNVQDLMELGDSRDVANKVATAFDEASGRARFVAVDPRVESEWASLAQLIKEPEDMLEAWRDKGLFIVLVGTPADALLITLAEMGLIEVHDTTGRLSSRSRDIARVSDDEAQRILGSAPSGSDPEPEEPAPTTESDE